MRPEAGVGRSARYRWSVASRVLAASAGGYALTTLVTLALSLLLPHAGLKQPPVVLGSTMASFVTFVVIIMAVFHARSARRAWLWIVGTGVPLALIVWLLMPGKPA